MQRRLLSALKEMDRLHVSINKRACDERTDNDWLCRIACCRMSVVQEIVTESLQHIILEEIRGKIELPSLDKRII